MDSDTMCAAWVERGFLNDETAFAVKEVLNSSKLHLIDGRMRRADERRRGSSDTETIKCINNSALFEWISLHSIFILFFFHLFFFLYTCLSLISLKRKKFINIKLGFKKRRAGLKRFFRLITSNFFFQMIKLI